MWYYSWVSRSKYRFTGTIRDHVLLFIFCNNWHNTDRHMPLQFLIPKHQIPRIKSSWCTHLDATHPQIALLPKSNPRYFICNSFSSTLCVCGETLDMTHSEEYSCSSLPAKADAHTSYVDESKVVRKLDISLIPIVTLFYFLSFLVRDALTIVVIFNNLACYLSRIEQISVRFKYSWGVVLMT